MRVTSAVLLLLLATEPVRVPSDPGLYYLNPPGTTRIEGRAVTVSQGRSRMPLGRSLPTPMKGVVGGGQTRAEILGERAAQKVISTPVFYYRVEAGQEATGAGDLVLVKLRVKKNRRDFLISSAGEWQSNAGVPLRSQVEFYSKQVASGLYKLTPAEDLKPGEYGFYLFRGRDLPGFLYDFSVASPDAAP